MNLKSLLKSGETKNIEFKREIPSEHKKYIKTVVAFANGFGGKIIFGVEEKDGKCELCGIDGDVLKAKDTITNAIFSNCEPHILPNVTIDTIEDKNIIIVDVLPGWDRPYYIKSEGEVEGVYVRVSGTTRKSDRSMTKELLFEGSNRFFDKTVCLEIDTNKKKINELCEQLYLVAQKNAKTEKQFNDIEKLTVNDLLAWGILVEKDNKIVPTNAYALLEGNPVLPNRIQCALFKGNDKTEIIDMKEYTGPIYEQIEFAYNFVLRNIKMKAVINDLYRENKYEIPPYAIRELIVNAVAHRSYIDRNTIKVAIYDNRLEISSPGKLPLGQTIEKMKQGNSNIRNEALAYVLRYLKYIENWGHGIPKIIQACKNAGLKEPVFVGGETELVISILRNKDFENEALNEALNGALNGALNDSEEKILTIIRANPCIKQKDIIGQSGFSRTQVQRIMRKLQKEGIIVHENSKKAGNWKVVDQKKIDDMYK